MTVDDFITSLPKHEQNFLAYMQKMIGKHALKSFILLDGEVVETTMMVAVLWIMRHEDDIRVALDTVGPWEISTVFLTQPHGVRGDLHFETTASSKDRTAMFHSGDVERCKGGS